MASFGSALPPFDPSSYDNQPPYPAPPPPLTGAEQMRALKHAGQSVSQIAQALGLPVSQVESELGVSATAASSTTSISIKA